MSVQVYKIQSTAKSIFKDLDLYGIPVLIECLKKYPYISWRTKSIPTEGSPTHQTHLIKTPNAITEVKKLIAHKDGRTTIITNMGYLQFWAAGMLNDN
jgi:hypothetical protein